MSRELATTSHQNHYVPARIAAERVGYTVDYIARLARKARVQGERRGRAWYVDLESVKLFSLEMEAAQRRRREETRLARRAELLARHHLTKEAQVNVERLQRPSPLVWGETAVLMLSCALVISLGWSAYSARLDVFALATGVSAITESLSDHLGGQSHLAAEAPALQRLNVLTPTSTREIPVAPTHNHEALLLLPTSTTPTDLSAIADSFSDHVTVEYEDDRTGIIRPQFKAPSDEFYRFLLVPVNPVGS